jgi:pro-sigmaK processing inhibitor BofA
MMELLIYLAVGVALVIFLYLFWQLIKKLIVNSLVGLFFLFLLKYAFQVPIPINWWTIAVTALFGLAGVGSILILHLGGMILN